MSMQARSTNLKADDAGFNGVVSRYLRIKPTRDSFSACARATCAHLSGLASFDTIGP